MLSYKIGELEIILRFERVYNYLDIPEMSHVHISNKTEVRHHAGRGYTFPIDYFEKYVDREVIFNYVKELGEILALLNYQCQIRLHDIEFVIGQGLTTPRLYILDFDRCDICDINMIIEKREENELMRSYDYRLLKIREYLDLANLSEDLIDIFMSSYILKSMEFNIPPELVDIILKNLTRN